MEPLERIPPLLRIALSICFQDILSFIWGNNLSVFEQVSEKFRKFLASGMVIRGSNEANRVEVVVRRTSERTKDVPVNDLSRSPRENEREDLSGV
jgi:hypothetical protein